MRTSKGCGAPIFASSSNAGHLTRAQQKGDFHLENKENLFKLIASNNSILTDVVSTLKILDRSEIAWRYGGQAQILWVKLREGNADLWSSGWTMV